MPHPRVRLLSRRHLLRVNCVDSYATDAQPRAVSSLPRLAHGMVRRSQPVPSDVHLSPLSASFVTSLHDMSNRECLLAEHGGAYTDENTLTVVSLRLGTFSKMGAAGTYKTIDELLAGADWRE